jgi:hypothetical protein
VSPSPAPAAPAPPADANATPATAGDPPADATPAPTTTTEHTSPAAGAFDGSTSQRGGRLALTVDGARVGAITIGFALRCGRTTRSNLHATAAAAAPLTSAHGVWSFSAAFTDRRGWRYSIHGRFSSATRVAGTLSITSRNRACTAHAIRWSARAS